MITIRKLSTLKPRTRLRKIVRLLTEAELALSGDVNRTLPDWDYLGRLGQIAGAVGEAGAGPPIDRVIRAGRSLAEVCRSASGTPDEAELHRTLNGLRHALLAFLGEDASEWDLVPLPDSHRGLFQEGLPTRARTLPITVYLEDIRSPFNVGSIVRTSAAFGIERVVLSPDCAPLEHPRALRSAMGAERMIRVERAELAPIAISAAHLFALEQGGTPLPAFRFPPSGVVILGSEELGVSPHALRTADERDGRVTIPLGGPKVSLNVGVAAGVLLAVWAERLTAAGPR